MGDLFRILANGLRKATPRWFFLLVYGTYAAVRNTYNLLVGYGLMKSAYLWKSADRRGLPIPWFSYPAVEYLDGLDLSELSVLEFGSGFSTLYWSRRAKSVVAVEDDLAWADRVRGMLGDNASLRLVTVPADYPVGGGDPGMAFDLIVIDGSHRLACATAVASRLRPGGIVILDDADDHSEVAAVLRGAGLLQVDFAGFNPINTYTKTTSFFFDRRFEPKARGAVLPLHSICHFKRNDSDGEPTAKGNRRP